MAIKTLALARLQSLAGNDFYLQGGSTKSEKRPTAVAAKKLLQEMLNDLMVNTIYLKKGNDKVEIYVHEPSFTKGKYKRKGWQPVVDTAKSA